MWFSPSLSIWCGPKSKNSSSIIKIQIFCESLSLSLWWGPKSKNSRSIIKIQNFFVMESTKTTKEKIYKLKKRFCMYLDKFSKRVYIFKKCLISKTKKTLIPIKNLFLDCVKIKLSHVKWNFVLKNYKFDFYFNF